MPQNRLTSILAGLGLVSTIISTYIANTPDSELPEFVIQNRKRITFILFIIITLATYNNPTSTKF